MRRRRRGSVEGGSVNERERQPSRLARGRRSADVPRLAVGLLMACGAMSGCGRADADIVVVGGPIWTADPAKPWAEGLAVRGTRIVAVGPAVEIRSLVGPRTAVVELDGRFAMPGFIDTHAHFIEGGFRLSGVDLREAASPDALASRLAEFVETVEDGVWILGGDWDHQLWGGELPDRSWIDAVTPRNPVLITRLDGHMALANTYALELAGIDEVIETPPGGEIVRDASGRLTGVFKDEAMSLLQAHVPEPTAEQRDSALRAAMRHAASVGVTGVHDMGSWENLETYRRAHARGDLTLRVYAFVPLSSWERLAEEVERRDGAGDGWLRLGGLKGFVDGSLGSGTAFFCDPYAGEQAYRGLQVTPLEELREQMRAADAAGLHIAVHAIGDCANGLLLDLYGEIASENGSRDRRHRVEHAQHLRPADYGRFARLRVIAAMQPYHAIDDGRWAESRIGQDRIQSTYAFRDLLDAGAEVAFGSDWTVAPLDPLLGVYAAVTRRTLDGAHPDGWVPGQRIRVEEALTAYTAVAARAGFFDGVTGMLREGWEADLVIIDRNPFEVDPQDLADLKVRLTIVGGTVVFQAD